MEMAILKKAFVWRDPTNSSPTHTITYSTFNGWYKQFLYLPLRLDRCFDRQKMAVSPSWDNGVAEWVPQ